MKAGQLINMLHGLEDFDLKDCGITTEILEALGVHYCEQYGITPDEMETLKVFGVWHLNTVPETDRRVLCCTRTKAGMMNIVIGYYADRWCCGMNSNVIAWMELPKPPEVEECQN